MNEATSTPPHRRVLVISAHPDDELLGLGGTVARHVDRGDDVSVVIASEGASSRYADSAKSELEQACHKAASVLGISNVRFLGLPDQKLETVPLIDIVQAIEAQLREIQPDVAYTHHWGDINSDHGIVSNASAVACRPPNPHAPNALYAYETPSSTEWGIPAESLQFVPTRFVDIERTLERKLEAMACYTSELRPAPHPRSLEALKTRAAYWGQWAACAYAEPFVVVREIVR